MTRGISKGWKLEPALFDVFIIELTKAWSLLGLWVYIPTPEVWLLGWGLVPCCADKSGLQSAVEGLRPGPALAVGSCFRLRVLCQGHCPGDGTSAQAQAAPGAGAAW